MYGKTESIIDSILFVLNEFLETNGSSRFNDGISHFEELLGFVQIFIKFFSYSQAFRLCVIFFKLSGYYETDTEEVDHYSHSKKNKIMNAYRINKLRSHFFVYSINPVKIAVYIILIIRKIVK